MPGFFLLNRGGISEANTAVLQRKQPAVWCTLQHYTIIWLWQHFRIISVGFYLYSLINHIFSNMSNLLIKKALSSEAFWCFLALWSNTVLQGFCKTLLWELCYGKWLSLINSHTKSVKWLVGMASDRWNMIFRHFRHSITAVFLSLVDIILLRPWVTSSY